MKTDKINIKQLLDKYFEGKTSLQEEQTLRNYFRQDNIDESLLEFKPMFDFFNAERELTMLEENETIVIPEQTNRPKRNKILFSRISIGIAASFMLFLSIKFTFFNQQKDVLTQSIVYVDGKKFTDVKTIKSQTLNTIEAIIYESEDDIISSQIDILNSFNDF